MQPAQQEHNVSAIGYSHKICGYEDPTDNFAIRQLLEGFRRLRPKQPDSRLPITLPMLHRILDSLIRICYSQYEVLCFQAAFTLAFFGFMRVGEIGQNLIVRFKGPSFDWGTSNFTKQGVRRGSRSLSDVQKIKEVRHSLSLFHVVQ